MFRPFYFTRFLQLTSQRVIFQCRVPQLPGTFIPVTLSSCRNILGRPISQRSRKQPNDDCHRTCSHSKTSILASSMLILMFPLKITRMKHQGHLWASSGFLKIYDKPSSQTSTLGDRAMPPHKMPGLGFDTKVSPRHQRRNASLRCQTRATAETSFALAYRESPRIFRQQKCRQWHETAQACSPPPPGWII